MALRPQTLHSLRTGPRRGVWLGVLPRAWATKPHTSIAKKTHITILPTIGISAKSATPQASCQAV
jgi:hypothetical protein